MINKTILELPEQAIVKHKENILKELEKEKSQLGLFKIKERKDIQTKITQAKTELENAKSNLINSKKHYEHSIEELQNFINEQENLLTTIPKNND